MIKDMDSNPVACIDWKQKRWTLCSDDVMFIYALKPFFDGQQPTTEREDGTPLYASAKVKPGSDGLFSFGRSFIVEMAITKYTSEPYLSWTDFSCFLFQRTWAVVKGKDPSRGGCCVIKRKPSTDEITATVAPNIDPILIIVLMICWQKYLYRRNCAAFFLDLPCFLFFAWLAVCAFCEGESYGAIFICSMWALMISASCWLECVMFLCSKTKSTRAEEMVDTVTESTALLAKDV